MFCAISGEIPNDPVVCKTTGVLFEKSLVTKYLNGGSSSCPVTNIPMRIDDLIDVKVSSGTAAKPRLPISDSSSIPGLLKTFQNEWDELMLETFTLKQHLDATRKELSHALFQHEAACRVVGRLTKERDEAINMMHTMQAAGISAAPAPIAAPAPAPAPAPPALKAAAVEKAPEPVGLTPAILSEINAKCKELSSGRKGRKPHEQTTSKEAMMTLAQTNSFTPHKSDNKTGGLNCVAVSGETVLSGGCVRCVML
jgi:pre-mRNA-processing factor 19